MFPDTVVDVVVLMFDAVVVGATIGVTSSSVSLNSYTSASNPSNELSLTPRLEPEPRPRTRREPPRVDGVWLAFLVRVGLGL